MSFRRHKAADSNAKAVIALVGLALEARIASGPNVIVICHDKSSELASAITAAANSGSRSIISFGLAGGLTPGLRAGDLIVASAIVDNETIRSTDAAWSSRLCGAAGGSNYMPIMGIDAPVVDPAQRRGLHLTGAAAVDTESHLMARVAERHGMTFAALRVVVDPAHRFVPKAALAAVRNDGTINFVAALEHLLVRPTDVMSLLPLAIELLIARAKLIRVRNRVGSGFAYVDAEQDKCTRVRAWRATP